MLLVWEVRQSGPAKRTDGLDSYFRCHASKQHPFHLPSLISGICSGDERDKRHFPEDLVYRWRDLRDH